MISLKMDKKGRYNPHFQNYKSVENLFHSHPLEPQHYEGVVYKPLFLPLSY